MLVDWVAGWRGMRNQDAEIDALKRKQGRTRFFKLSTATSQHFSGAPKGVA